MEFLIVNYARDFKILMISYIGYIYLTMNLYNFSHQFNDIPNWHLVNEDETLAVVKYLNLSY